MNTVELSTLLSNHPCTQNAFVGVVAVDKLPKRIYHYPALLIVNTDCASEPGSHWVCLYLGGDWGYFFDSYGCEPSFWDDQLDQFMCNQTNCAFSWNTKTLQSLHSDTCGEWCLLAADRLCRQEPTTNAEVMNFPLMNNSELCLWVDSHFMVKKFGLILQNCDIDQSCSCMKHNLQIKC